MKAIISAVRWNRRRQSHRKATRNSAPEFQNLIYAVGQTILSMYTVMRHSIPRPARANLHGPRNIVLEVYGIDAYFKSRK
jgi:hypothetical protein